MIVASLVAARDLFYENQLIDCRRARGVDGFLTSAHDSPPDGGLASAIIEHR
jgi:hypothetical protein